MWNELYNTTFSLICLQLQGPLTEHQAHQFHLHRHHPYLHYQPANTAGSIQKKSTSLLRSRRISKSLDWTEFPGNSHSALWEPFCELLDSPFLPNADGPGASVTDDYFYYTQPGVTQFLHEVPNEEGEPLELTTCPHHVLRAPSGPDHKGNVEILTCAKCLSLTASSVKDEIDSLTSSLVGEGGRGREELEAGSTSTGLPIPIGGIRPNVGGMAGKVSTIGFKPTQPRPPRPTLAFTLPIPQLSLTTQSGSRPTACTSTTGSCSTKGSHYISASVDHGIINSGKGAHAVIEGRGKSSRLPTIDSKHITAIRNAEKRRRFFARKQTNSAPDSFEASSFFNVTTHGVINTTREYSQSFFCLLFL